jgi:hypothetical protein
MSPIPNEEQPKQPPGDPEPGRKGPRTPYPVGDPVHPKGPGSEPDYFPGKPGSDVPTLRSMLGVRRRRAGPRRIFVGWLQAH